MEKIFENIKNRRKMLHISQDRLAEQTGYTDRSSIARIERGEIDIPQSKIILFAKALKCTPCELMGWTEEDDIVAKMNRLSESDRQYVFGQIDALFSKTEKNGESLDA